MLPASADACAARWMTIHPLGTAGHEQAAPMEHLVLRRRLRSADAVREPMDDLPHGRGGSLQPVSEAAGREEDRRAHGPPGADYWPTQGADQRARTVHHQPGRAPCPR